MSPVKSSAGYDTTAFEKTLVPMKSDICRSSRPGGSVPVSQPQTEFAMPTLVHATPPSDTLVSSGDVKKSPWIVSLTPLLPEAMRAGETLVICGGTGAVAADFISGSQTTTFIHERNGTAW